MHIHRIAYTQLAVLIKPDCEYTALLCQKQTVKFAARNFLNLLPIEVWLSSFYRSIVYLLNLNCA